MSKQFQNAHFIKSQNVNKHFTHNAVTHLKSTIHTERVHQFPMKIFSHRTSRDEWNCCCCQFKFIHSTMCTFLILSAISLTCFFTHEILLFNFFSTCIVQLIEFTRVKKSFFKKRNGIKKKRFLYPTT